MWSLLRSLALFVLGGMIARVLTGAGLALVSYVIVIDLVTDALDFGASQLGGMPGAALNIALMMGVGEFLTIVGSAIVARAAIVAAASAIGIKVTE